MYQLAIDSDMIAAGDGFSAKRCHNLAVDQNAPLLDQGFGLAPRHQPGRGYDLLKPFLFFHGQSDLIARQLGKLFQRGEIGQVFEAKVNQKFLGRAV